MIRLLIIVLALLVTSSASAQHAVVMDLGDSAFVILFDAQGNTTIFPNASIVRQGSPPTATNPYTVPSATMRTAVEKLTTLSFSRADATAVAKVYGDAATSLPSTTEALKQRIIDSGKTLNLKGKYPGAATTIDEVLKALLGLDVRPTTVSDTSTLRAVAWAIWEAGR